MAIYKLFDINTATTVKPWGAREEQVIKDIIDTLVVDTIDVTKNTSGHLHGKLYASDSVSSFDSSTSNSVSIIMRDNETSGLVIKNRTGTSIMEVDSSTTAPKATFNYDADVVGKLYGDIYDLYDNPMIETRNTDSTIYFTSDKTAGIDVNLDTSTFSFRIHDDTTELFRIYEPVATPVARYDISVDINGDVDISGTLDSHGAVHLYSTLQIDSIGASILDTNVFLVGDSNVIKYRTGAQLLSDLSGDAAGTFSWNSQSLTAINDLSCTTVTASGEIEGGSLDINGSGDISGSIDVHGATHLYTTLTVDTIANVVTDTDRFIVSDSGIIKYRTGAQLLSDLSGDAGASFSWNSQSLTNINDISCATIGITSLTSGYLPYHTGSTLDDSVVFTDGTNVGVGTAGPIVKLEVSSTGNTVASLVSTDANAYISFVGSSTTGYGSVRVGAYNDEMKIYAGGSESVRINSSGNMGVGETSPDTKLHVNSGTQDYVAHFESTDTYSIISFADNTTYATLGWVGLGAVGDKLVFRTGGSRHMLLDDSGNLGIGTETPGQRLHIYKTADPKIEIEDLNSSLTLTVDSTVTVVESEDLDLALKAPSGNAVKIDTASFFGLPVKTDTGDPASPSEGYIYVNTFDNAVRLYADSAWRSIFTW